MPQETVRQARVTRWVIIDAPLPGIGPWDEIIRSPALWHFNFRGPDVERLVKGRERIYLDRFYNELSANPKAIDEKTRRLVASNVEGGVIANSGHWIMEEQPVATVKAVRDFLERK